MRDDDLSVTLCTQGSGLEQRLEVEHAALIHVQACNRVRSLCAESEAMLRTSLDVVKSVRDTVNTVEEGLVVNIWHTLSDRSY